MLTNAYYPTWTPDGSHITYVDSTHAIDSVAADGQGSVQMLYTNSSMTLYSPTYSPDGKNLAWVGQAVRVRAGRRA